jgi:chromosome segregation ATPase
MKPKPDREEHPLAEPISELAREIHELHLELKRSNENKSVLNRMEEMECRIMSAISTYAAKQKEYNDRHGAAIDSIVTSQTGLSGDIAELKRLIEELQNSPGEISPEDQALLDDLQALGEEAATKAEAQAAALKALDESTPPVVPPVPNP